MALTPQQVTALTAPDLLTKICEEAAEVIQAVCKQANHGPTPFAGGVQYNNVADVVEESRQLNGLLTEYRRRFGHYLDGESSWTGL